jgi:phosphoribosylaminoimidazole-succinocarboxamide synthase
MLGSFRRSWLREISHRRCARTLRVELIRQGKVRDVYADGDDLILVASDRVSVYDVVLPTPIPDKGAILTQLSLWWFGQMADLAAAFAVGALTWCRWNVSPGAT